MESKNVNIDDDNVLASNLYNVIFYFIKKKLQKTSFRKN